MSGIRATDVATGLRRIPVGFHVSVGVDGAEWRTANKLISVDTSMIGMTELHCMWSVSRFSCSSYGLSPLARDANVHFRMSKHP